VEATASSPETATDRGDAEERDNDERRDLAISPFAGRMAMVRVERATLPWIRSRPLRPSPVVAVRPALGPVGRPGP
jgi:hypothetical protein